MAILNQIHYLFLILTFASLIKLGLCKDYVKKMILLQVAYINFILFLIIYFNITGNSYLTSVIITVLVAFIFTFFAGVGIVINISNNKSNKEVK